MTAASYAFVALCCFVAAWSLLWQAGRRPRDSVRLTFDVAAIFIASAGLWFAWRSTQLMLEAR